MIHKTRGIVLRSVKYGETSLILTMFTELFGLQSYIINGVRMASKKGSSKSFFQVQVLFFIRVFIIYSKSKKYCQV